MIYIAEFHPANKHKLLAGESNWVDKLEFF